MQLRGRFDFTGAKDTPRVVPAGFQLETQARQFRVCSLSNTEKKLDRSSLHCVVEENKDLNQPTREVVMFVDKCLI